MTRLTKRLITAAVTLACFAALEWLSGLPWGRSPGMAFYWLCAGISAVIVTQFVGYRGDE
jgi:hypothetical protein